MTVSAVVRAYNEERHLGRLLHGLHRQTMPVDEVIVVDSGSTDRTVDVAREHGATVVHIDPEDFTFGRSLNFGCRAASGDQLLIVSAHVYPVYDTFVERLSAPFAEGPARTAVAYGRQIGDHRTKFSEARILQQWFPEHSSRDQGHPFSNNANAMVDRDVWAKLGYDEHLTGLEDLEFAKRAIEELGMCIDYVAEAPVVHVHEETWSSVRNRYRREAIAYKAIMRHEQFSPSRAVRLAAANIARDYTHALRSGVLGSNLVEIPWFRIAQFLGAAEGFRDDSGMSERLIRRFYYPDGGRNAAPSLPGALIDYQSVS